MEAQELRQKFLRFFQERGHTIVPSSSLIPDDPSVLLTTAGMQQFKPYFLDKADPLKDFGAKRAASIQKAFRTSDIDEVGDESHLTFFEMLGHFSFGDYFKKETIEWTYELLTKNFGISKDRISATVFVGDEKIPFDQESYDAWLRFLPESNIRKGPRADNVWGPPGGAGTEGPCGAANEVYVDNLEVATLVFMEYNCAPNGDLTPLPKKGVDVGWGFERIVKVVQAVNTVFDIDSIKPLLELLPNGVDIRHKRIIVDHLRGATFLLADGVRPSNKDRGYILRRLMRRAFVYEYLYKIPVHVFDALIHDIVHEYGEFYGELLRENENIREEFKKEKEKFSKTLSPGLKKIAELIQKKQKEQIGPANEVSDTNTDFINRISGDEAFDVYQSYGFQRELINEILAREGYTFNQEEFDEAFNRAFQKHQEISRAGQEKKFGGHGLILDTGELKAADERELKIVTRLHTATHLLNAALHKVLGDSVVQNGSDITVERTRFDFNFPRKLTAEEIKKIEDLVNYAIKQDFKVSIETVPLEQAKKTGALYMERSKYPDPVKVYTVSNEKEVFSKELCGGPHVEHTNTIGQFKILKEESSSAGIRRIRARVE